MDFQTQIQVEELTLALEEEKEVHTQTLEEPSKKDDDFELNEDAKDVIYDNLYHTYSLDFQNEKLVLDLLAENQVHKIQTGVGSEGKKLFHMRNKVDGKEINVLLLLESNQSDFECS